LPLVLHNFRMAANQGRCAPSYITDDHHRRLLTGDHLHHGLLGHELRHVPQWVSMGTLSFIREYTNQVETSGYSCSPLESEGYTERCYINQ
jgi:hypothetical protein